jgi:hypothetical protein
MRVIQVVLFEAARYTNLISSSCHRRLCRALVKINAALNQINKYYKMTMLTENETLG